MEVIELISSIYLQTEFLIEYLTNNTRRSGEQALRRLQSCVQAWCKIILNASCGATQILLVEMKLAVTWKQG